MENNEKASPYFFLPPYFLVVTTTTTTNQEVVDKNTALQYNTHSQNTTAYVERNQNRLY